MAWVKPVITSTKTSGTPSNTLINNGASVSMYSGDQITYRDSGNFPIDRVQLRARCATAYRSVILRIEWLTRSNSYISSSTKSFTNLSTYTFSAPNNAYRYRITNNNGSNVLGLEYVTHERGGILPSIISGDVTDIKSTSATASGDITDLGVPNPTQHGHVWNTSSNPTIGLSTKTTLGGKSSTGSFTSSMENLNPNTTYYVRAYATNSEGTVYSSSIQFTTDIKEAFLVESDKRLWTYQNYQWTEVAEATEEIFKNQGITDISQVPKEAWIKIMNRGDSSLLGYHDRNEDITLNISYPKSLHELSTKSYKGQGVIETESEILPEERKTLFINAEHTNCTFEVSLDNGSTWHDLIIDEPTDISEKEGNELKIRIHLPETASELRAISYAWV